MNMTTIKPTVITMSAIAVVIVILVTTSVPHTRTVKIKLATRSNAIELVSDNHQYGAPRLGLLNTTLYTEKCLEGSEGLNFLTPIHKCYNGYNHSHALFTEHDIYDVVITLVENSGVDEESHEGVHVQQIGIQRTFYKSTDGSCSGGKTDSFDNIPVGSCVGPFGPPYPWGILSIVEESPSVIPIREDRS